MRVYLLTRLVTIVCLASCLLAILLGRSVPRTSGLRYVPSALDPINGLFFGFSGRGSFVLDTRTGARSALLAPPRQSIEWASFAPWVDSSGERDFVARWSAWSRGGPREAVQVGSGLALLSYPSGRIRETIDDVPIPNSRPCWSPLAYGRVVYSGTDGRLYECDFGEADSRRVESPRVRRIEWSNLPAGLHEPFIETVTWPAEPAFGGRLLATIRSRASQRSLGPSRLWWLKLSADGMRIVDAEKITVEPEDCDSLVGESCPSLYLSPNGRLRLTFQRSHRRVDKFHTLYVAETDIGRFLASNRILASEIRLLANDVAHVPASFSPDGRLVHALVGLSPDVVVVRRFPVGRDLGS